MPESEIGDVLSLLRQTHPGTHLPFQSFTVPVADFTEQPFTVVGPSASDAGAPGFLQPRAGEQHVLHGLCGVRAVASR